MGCSWELTRCFSTSRRAPGFCSGLILREYIFLAPACAHYGISSGGSFEKKLRSLGYAIYTHLLHMPADFLDFHNRHIARLASFTPAQGFAVSLLDARELFLSLHTMLSGTLTYISRRAAPSSYTQKPKTALYASSRTLIHLTLLIFCALFPLPTSSFTTAKYALLDRRVLNQRPTTMRRRIGASSARSASSQPVGSLSAFIFHYHFMTLRAFKHCWPFHTYIIQSMMP